MFWGVFGFWGSLLGSIPFWGVPGLVYPTFERVSGGAYSLFRGGGGGCWYILFAFWGGFAFGDPCLASLPFWGARTPIDSSMGVTPPPISPPQPATPSWAGTTLALLAAR